ncbi:MAG: ATP-binding protein, partial [Myxococcota bacterium]
SVHETVVCSACSTEFELEGDEGLEENTRCPDCGSIGTLARSESYRFEAAPDRTRRYLQRITSNGRHLLRVVNDILDLSKLESGQMVLQCQPVGVAELVAESISLVETLAERERITLNVALDVPENLVSFVDPLRMKQVVLNLVANAIKFSSSGSSVDVALSCDEDVLEFSVRDRGMGISEQDQKIIFDSFTQAESAYGREHGGSGLGLAITRHIVELHSGEITVESELGVGSVFRVRLPRRDSGPVTVEG